MVEYQNDAARRVRLDAVGPVNWIPSKNTSSNGCIKVSLMPASFSMRTKDQGYAGGTTVLRDFMQPYRPVLAGRTTIRYETEPGHQAQVDWAHFGHLIDSEGIRKPLYCFVMVLSYSRMLYLEFTTSQDAATLLRCHLNAFDFFSGIPTEILYDNAKTIVTGRDSSGNYSLT